MTYIYPMVLCLLVIITYVSSITSLIPLGLGYLLYLYSLKDLPKSTYKKYLISLTVIGFILSFMDLIIVHNFIIILNLIITTIMLNKKDVYIQTPSFVSSFVLYIGYLLKASSKHYAWLACLMIIFGCLYFIYKQTTLYLRDNTADFIRKRYKPISNKILIPTLIISVILSLVFYQEYNFKRNQRYFDSGYYTIENAGDFSLTYPYHYYISEYGYNQSYNISSSLRIPSEYYKNYLFTLYMYDQDGKELGFQEFTKKDNAPEILEDSTFNINNYYDLIAWSTNDYSDNFLNTSTRYIKIYGPPQEQAPSELLATIPLVSHSSFYEGRSLLSKVYIPYNGTNHDAFVLDFSVFLKGFINKTIYIQYEITEVSKQTGQRTILEDYKGYFSHYDMSTDLHVSNLNGFDFENNNYEISYQLFNQYDDAIFSDLVVID